jgi:hypothetical protein
MHRHDGKNPREWGWHRVKGRTLNQSRLIECVNLIKRLEHKIKYHVSIRPDGTTISSFRIGVQDQATFPAVLLRIREKLEEVLAQSEKSNSARKEI